MKPSHQQLDERIYPIIPGVSRPTTAPNKNQIKIDFAPSADEVARKVYLSYGNQGLLPGDELEHWLEAEAQLLTEHNVTRAHGSYTARVPIGLRMSKWMASL